MSTEIANMSIEAKILRVNLRVDGDLSVIVAIPKPEGDIDSLTVGQIKQMAMEAAKKKIP